MVRCVGGEVCGWGGVCEVNVGRWVWGGVGVVRCVCEMNVGWWVSGGRCWEVGVSVGRWVWVGEVV